ncbi:hypothetical protein STFR1_20102 [Bacillus vallismortis]
MPAIRQAKIELETKIYWAHRPYEVSEQKRRKTKYKPYVSNRFMAPI